MTPDADDAAHDVAREEVFRSEREASRADAGTPDARAEERDWDAAVGDGVIVDRAERAARIERRLELPLLAFALLTIPALLIEHAATAQPLAGVAIALNWMIWLAFFAEAAIMLAVTPNRWRWVRSHPLDVAIVVLTPPFLPASLQAARALRLLRLLRLVKAGVLVRRMLSTEGVRDATVLGVLTILGGSAAFAAVEGRGMSTWEGMWWAITTVTTVGYGDMTPQTDAGRAIAIFVMFVGIGFVAILTAAAAERFMRSHGGDDRVSEQLTEILERLRALEQRTLASTPSTGGSDGAIHQQPLQAGPHDVEHRLNADVGRLEEDRPTR